MNFENSQNHELSFWVKDFTPPLFHEEWYKSFFPFDSIEDKTILEIGCGGYPISQYSGYKENLKLSILDPLIDKLKDYEKFQHLKDIKSYSLDLLNFKIDQKFDLIICLNVLDHFEDPSQLAIQKIYDHLEDNGILWLYYDVRPQFSCDHFAVDHENILAKIEELFVLEKIDDSVNPVHINWSGITKSIRLIAKKK